MNVRNSTMADLPELRNVYAHGRELMRKNGNTTQWGNTFPTEEQILRDIEKGWGFVIEEDGAICGAFAFIIGPDPTYAVIKDGGWINDTDEYGTIHRLAANGKAPGVFDACIDFCAGRIANLRADTHPDNKVMQYLLASRGFKRCGIIFTSDDGTERIAYQRCQPV